MRVTWTQPEDLVRHELWQAATEGKDVTAIRNRWAATGLPLIPPRVGAAPEHADPPARRLARALLIELDELTDPTAAQEPSDWPEIIDMVADSPALQPVRATADPDRVRAAWLGRAVGCLLGKPVEKVPRAGIEAILHSTGRWPLDRYFTAVGLDPTVAEQFPWNRASRPTSLEENIDGMPEDDDLNYALMALRVLEARGSDFTSDDVAQGWLLDLPAGRTFTAERVAYRNLLDGISPPATARVRNPFREWIGAQIRTDVYGWVNPGNPLRAMDFAFRDAAVSHTRNGIYGALAVAAMSAVAITGAGTDEVLDAGMAAVPASSRMAAALAFGRELAADPANQADPRPAYRALEERFDGMHWVHALNNSALLAFALAAGAGDFSRTICLAVMGGWDTDSTGATAGALAGAMAGPAGIDQYWTAPLHDRLASSIPGCDGTSFGELAERTLVVAAAIS